MHPVKSIALACALGLTASSQVGSQAVPGSVNGRVSSPLPAVRIVALPDGGIQPHAVVDAAGTTHVLYFAGDPAAGDLYYFSVGNQDKKPSKPVRVNSVAGSALASGSVRGGQIAVGRNGRAHVAWHGSKPQGGPPALVPMWYTRSTGNQGAFAPQRAVSGKTAGLDGGTIAAGPSGQVAVAWHGDGTRSGDGHRTVYLATSVDDGATFLSPAPATDAPVGACGCCGMRALFDSSGALHVLYRAATDGKHRDTTWLTIDREIARPPVRVHPWNIEACPMTTYALVETPDGLAAAWETAQQVYSADMNSATSTVSTPSAIPGRALRRHPSIAVNTAGDRLIAWTEGTAWKRGGTFAWRLTDRTGNQRAAEPNAGTVAVWGLVSAVALPDGSFVIYR
jgi:hypothetical protein